MNLNPQTIAGLAEHLESAELNARDVTKITDEHPEMDWDDAYAIQDGIRRRKEARFAADVNHQISKRMVAEAQRTGRGIAVEQLGGIRARVRLRQPQRAAVHSWAFAQLGGFLAYKAKQAGVAFVEVNPAYTSQMCSACGWVHKHNRRSQSGFECGRCGFVGHADHNAAINIACRVSNAGAKSCAHTQRRP